VSRVLLVDDEPDYRRLLRLGIGGGHQFDEAGGAAEALERLDRAAYDVVLSDLQMAPGPDGIELLRAVRQREIDCPFVLLTGQASVETAVRAMREGAFDYLRKTAGPDEIRAVVARALEHGRMARELLRLRTEVDAAAGAGERPIGESAATKRVMALAEKVAQSDASVLLLGESGTGKELLARAIHRWSPRAAGPFVAFDCSALAPSLVESELFGHEKGAFTGAQRARRGLFREAQGGTLLLDEIGDIAPEMQNKLLRVLQEREIKPVGGDAVVKIDVRVMAATNQDLEALVAEKRFREDLYYRLAVVPIELPPLRERREDIPLLAAHFLGKRRGAGPRPRPRPGSIAADAMALLSAYRWPGNIRELENVIERAAILSDGDEIRARDLPPLEARATAPGPAGLTVDLDRPLKDVVDDAVERVEREAILAALRAEEGSPSRAARRLGISRAAFYNKVKRHGIDM
jgi:DNA-binding NtrC family response regulator